MIQAINAKNKTKALAILANAFVGNPNLNWMAPSPAPKYARNFCRYCLDLALLHQGAYLSSDGKGVILFHTHHAKLAWFKRPLATFYFLRLFFTTIDWWRLPEIFHYYHSVTQLRPKSDFLYCPMLAVSNESRSIRTIFELRNLLFQRSRELQLPIHLQTSTPKIKRIYEKIGFVLYQTVRNQQGKYQLWLLKKELG